MDIESIQAKCGDGKIRWSAHVAARLLQRGISREDVLSCINSGEIIEDYPDYWLNPACLIYGITVKGEVLHVVVGEDDYVHIVTAYHPSPDTFMQDMKTRREQ